MVSPQLPALANAHICKSFQNHLFFPVRIPDVVPSDNIELDFSDVFGPLPAQASTEVRYVDPENSVPTADVTELVFDDPVVIYNRSHSLVGPSTCVSQSMKLSKLTIHETEDPLELVECLNKEAVKKVQELLVNDSIVEESRECAVYNSLEAHRVGLEDFEIMKLVGQGAFGKVFQVRKRCTSEIYAMKVMRKDKIMEKNHAEYMKAERDILTKIEHPYIVQLRYSFQAMLTDFGLAKQFDENTRSNSMCGTVEYMSPEIVLGKGHDKVADWWSVGILLFEMLTGKPPFIGGNRQKIQQKIMKDKIKLPAFLSSDAHSLLKGLLQKDPSKRLGNGPKGSDEVKCHKWFKPINWKKLEAREIHPNFRPEVAGNLCIANFDKCWTDMPLQDSPVSSPNANSNIFEGFTYVRPAASFLQRKSPPC
ncbi:non-specific serine,threonine protein kinase [Sarracenia purpurea var. burkii]